MTNPDDTGSPGWDAIDRCLSPLYPDQEPRHWGTIIKYCFGGPDPLDGVSVFRAEDPVPHWHYVSYGFTELYQKETDDPTTSGYGFELTLRLARAADATEPPTWPVSLLQNLARYVFSSGNTFSPGDHMDLNGPISLSEPTGLVAMAVAADSQLPGVDSPHGRLEFLQIVGLTGDEYAASKRWNTAGLLELMERVHPRLVMDLRRRSILEDPSIRAELDGRAGRDGSTTGLLFNDATSWRPERGWFGRSGVVVAIGANPARTVAEVLPARVPHGRSLTLSSKDRAVAFMPTDAARWQIEKETLQLYLTGVQAIELGAQLKRGVGTYTLDGLENVQFEVVPSIIKDSSGNVVREIR